MAPPQHWPSGVVYLDCPRFSRALSQAQLDSVLVDSPSSGAASLQLGLFAGEALEPGAFILPYLGFVHAADKDVDQSSDYDLSLDRELGVGIDAAKMGNEARFINDYRGVCSSGPNAEFRECWVSAAAVARGRRRAKTMGVFVLPAGKSGKRHKGIAKGEEILVSYGKGFWRERAREGEHEECGALPA